MKTLQEIFDGICDSSNDTRDENLNDIDQIMNYAEFGCGRNITQAQAEAIQRIAIRMFDELENGNGEYSRIRHAAMNEIEEYENA